jgi:hypothetical protein
MMLMENVQMFYDCLGEFFVCAWIMTHPCTCGWSNNKGTFPVTTVPKMCFKHPIVDTGDLVLWGTLLGVQQASICCTYPTCASHI